MSFFVTLIYVFNKRNWLAGKKEGLKSIPDKSGRFKLLKKFSLVVVAYVAMRKAEVLPRPQAPRWDLALLLILILHFAVSLEKHIWLQSRHNFSKSFSFFLFLYFFSLLFPPLQSPPPSHPGFMGQEPSTLSWWIKQRQVVSSKLKMK